MTESVVEKMVYGAASHGEVQAVAEVVGREMGGSTGGVDGGGRGSGHGIPQETGQLHEALGTGLASQGVRDMARAGDEESAPGHTAGETRITQGGSGES